MVTMEKLTNLCKQYGFIFQGSEIYGGLANTWDYGPLGVEVKNNVKKAWWQKFIRESKDSYGVDAAILMNSDVWKASGHVDSFSDPLVDCKECKTRHRADHLIEDFDSSIIADKMSNDEMIKFICDNHIKCPNCGKSNFTDIREFNLMFKTERGVTALSKNTIYLRPETAQGEFVNFLNVQRTMRAKVPFGIGQIGKAFRNEITPGNFTFRTLEFEQMEHQFFCKPGTDSDYYNEYKKKEMDFFVSLGINEDKLRFHDHDKLAHYAKEACDVEYEFDFGFSEIAGTHNRTDYDLKRHEEYSGKVMQYLDPLTNERYTPYVIESSIGCDRAVLAFLADAYREEVLSDGSVREVMSFHPFLAPYKVAILPLVKKHHSEKALEVFNMLSKEFMCSYDETGNIGKRYRRQDVSGTPYCLTVDDETINNGTVTIRDRDTMEQITLNLDEVSKYINDKLKF